MHAEKFKAQILEGPIAPTLIRMAVPMLIGIAAIVLFNIVDTFWVGQLGALELTAMSYTFPVVMIVTSLAMGVSIGGTAVIARALGHGDEDQVKRLTTDALVLANTLVIVVALIGLFTINPLFRALGADEQTLPLIRQYMVPWYLGVGLLVIPMVGNGAIRATGDTKTPSYVMMVAGLVNAVLDPFLIFGWGPAPELGLTGAALATIGSYAGALVAALYILIKREELIAFEIPKVSEVLNSWRRILHIGLPAAGTNLLSPVSAGIMTRMVSEYGEPAVGGFGVATRIEGFALIGIGAMSTAVTPFVAQNLGAGNCERIRGATRFVIGHAIVWGGGAALLLAVFRGPLAGIFSDNAEVIAAAKSYLLIVPISFITLGIAQLIGTTLNALNQPLKASALVATRLMVLAVPLAAAGSALMGMQGLFGGIAAANLVIGALAIAVVYRNIAHVERRLEADPTIEVAPAE